MVYAQVHWKVVFEVSLGLVRYLWAQSLPNFAQFAGGITRSSVTAKKRIRKTGANAKPVIRNQTRVYCLVSRRIGQCLLRSCVV